LKKIITILICFSISFYSTLLFADNNKFYIGGGGSFAYEDFDTDSDFDNTWGINAKAGYRFHEYIMFEFNFDYLNNFESDRGFTLFGEPVESEVEVTVYTWMLALKGYAPVYSDNVMFFAVVGGGVLLADIDTKLRGPTISESDSDDEVDGCAKIGFGIDYFPIQNLSAGIEGNYTLGFGDVDDVRYFNFTLGVAYHF
jgi:opacity protein-like surface antigen